MSQLTFTVPEWFFTAIGAMVLVGSPGLVFLGVTLYQNGREVTVYQTNDVIVLRQRPRDDEGKKHVYFVGEPTPEDLAVLAKALDENLLGNGEEVNRALLERLLLRTCVDGGSGD